jgi:hypothetical protein
MRIDPPGLSSLMSLLDARRFSDGTKVVVATPVFASPQRRHLTYPRRSTLRLLAQYDVLPRA